MAADGSVVACGRNQAWDPATEQRLDRSERVGPETVAAARAVEGLPAPGTLDELVGPLWPQLTARAEDRRQRLGR